MYLILMMYACRISCSASKCLTWAGDSVEDEPIADEDANRLLSDALDDTCSNASSMLGEMIFTAMQAAVVCAELGPNVMIMFLNRVPRRGYGCYYTANVFQS